MRSGVPPMPPDHRPREPVSSSLREYGRGIAGGLIFSLPLLYTMEVWWTGFLVTSTTLLAYIGITFVLLLGYNRFGGLRPDAHLLDVIIDSVEEMGLGLVLTVLILFLLGRITFEMPLQEVIGKIIVETMIVAIGVSIGTAQLGGSQQQDQADNAEGKGSSAEQPSFRGQMVLAFCGAVLFAANIAPTEEVVLVAIGTPSWRLLGLALLSMLLGAVILYFSDFLGARPDVRRGGYLAMILGTIATYAVALLASALMLWFFQRFNSISLATMLSETVVLGFAANLGASAGRLLIQ